MRKTAIISVLSALLFQANAFDFGKIIDNVVEKTDKKASSKVEDKLDSAVDSIFGKAEDSVSNVGKGSSKNDTGAENSSDTAKEPSSNIPKTASWNRYDFVPGDTVIFDDDLQGETSGEFPSKWDMTKGVFENAKLGEDNVIVFVKANTNGGAGIVPLIKNSNKDYLPEQFTVEFDAYFEKENESQYYTVWFSDLKNQGRIKTNGATYIEIKKNSMSYHTGGAPSYYPGTNNGKSSPVWRHISISFNTRALKAYLDDVRLLNIPNLGYDPSGITIGFMATQPSSHGQGYIKNIRIAQGAVPLYDKMMKEGKIVTTGIRFDVNQATIKPESAGVINEIVALMKQNPSLRFSIEGHTDSDGDEHANQILSQERADAVKDRFVELGIEASRLQTKGFGEDKPISSNATQEGKANNRRVEFIKL